MFAAINQEQAAHLVQGFGQCTAAWVTFAAYTFERELDSFASTCSCFLPVKTCCGNLELSLALHSNEAAVYKAIKQSMWGRTENALTVPLLLPRDMLPNCCAPSAMLALG